MLLFLSLCLSSARNLWWPPVAHLTKAVLLCLAFKTFCNLDLLIRAQGMCSGLLRVYSSQNLPCSFQLPCLCSSCPLTTILFFLSSHIVESPVSPILQLQCVEKMQVVHFVYSKPSSPANTHWLSGEKTITFDPIHLKT